MQGMHAATGPRQTVAIHRADLFPFQSLHDRAREASRHEFQYRPVIYHRLECGECRPLHTTTFYLPEQQWVQPRAQQRQLLLGDAHDHRLRNELPEELLRHWAPADQ